MTRTLQLLAFVLMTAFAPSALAKLRVVATTPDLAAVARSVGGDQVKVEALSLPTQDPHWVDARPHLALKLARADLLLTVGLELEIGWLPTLQTASRNRRIQKGAKGHLDCSTLVKLLEVPMERIDRTMGDIHPGGNPHYMLDPRRVARVAWGVAKRMASIDPANAATYHERGKKYVGRLKQSRRGWEKSLAGARGKGVVTYHRSLVYLADWVGLKVIDRLEPKPGIPPTPRHVAQVIRAAKQQRAVALLQESWFPTKTSKLVSNKAGIQLVSFPGGPNFKKGQSYEAFMDDVVAALKKGIVR